jgi:hypothetical protein
LVFEVVFFFVSLSALGAWLFAREGLYQWRLRHRARRVQSLLRGLEGRPVVQAETVLGPPVEIVNGSGGRSLYVWKDPASRAIPRAASLLIITLTVDAAGIVTHTAYEER